MAFFNFERMEEARKDKRMEFTELAFRVGLSETHIRQILNGTTGCSEKTMWKIAHALKLSPKKLELELEEQLEFEKQKLEKQQHKR
jgi:transcriptional regulator with XRE-family HTH domain